MTYDQLLTISLKHIVEYRVTIGCYEIFVSLVNKFECTGCTIPVTLEKSYK